MNRHAEKPTEPRTREEARRAEAALGVLIESIHQCPRCGHIEGRVE